MRGWSHAVMLLLGITLTVGFYEGRRLVTNTMRALRIGDATPGLAVRLDPDAADARSEDARKGRTGSRKTVRATGAEGAAEEERTTQRERVRARGGFDAERGPSGAVPRTRDLGEGVDRELALPADPLAPRGEALEDDTGEPLP
jgi:hypothetical protein